MSKKRKNSTAMAGGISGLLMLCCCCAIATGTILPDSPAKPTETKMANEQITQSLPTNTSIPTSTFTIVPIELTFTATSIATSTFAPLETLSALGFSCVPSTTKREEGVVTNIVDGDTIDVVINGQTFRVRYIGIDTPERYDTFYEQATQANRELVYNKTVLLVNDVSETDRYERILRYVFVGNTFVNYELVKQGYALAYTYPPDVACSDLFVKAQNQAQSSNVGLWVSTPIPPTAVNNNSGGGGGGGGGNCDPAYPTVCIPPPPPDLDCKDVPYKRFQVLPPDPHRFDRDNDGIGCES